MKYVTTGKSTKNIREFALNLRSVLNFSVNDYIKMPKLYDVLSLLLGESGFCYSVLDDSNQIFDCSEEAKTDVKSKTIFIKESVFNESCRRRYCRSNFTLAHELGHWFLHAYTGRIFLCRNENEIPAYEDPEWQANKFAEEFLMPYEGCQGLSPKEIRKKYHVSLSCAQTRYDNVNKKLAN